MKERPILFSGPMVRALLAGRKTQTRRAIKGLPESTAHMRTANGVHFQPIDAAGNEIGGMISCPYGVPGDRLWVKEALRQRDDGSLVYDSDGAEVAREKIPDDFAPARRWCSSIHMPRWASRITLEVVSVRVERVQEITEADAIAEGCDASRREPYVEPDEDPRLVGYPSASAGWARDNYSRIWDSINGAGSWSANPWVWVVEFRKVEA